MACVNNCKLCQRLTISDSVTFATGNVLIDIPAGAYRDGEKYCIVVAQAIPNETTINAPVYITIGGDVTTLYALIRKNGAQATASGIRTRTRYATRVVTTPTGGSFHLLGGIPCVETNNLVSIPAPEAPTPPEP